MLKMETRPGLAPDSSVLQTVGSTTLPCASEKWGDQWDLHPTPRLSQSRMLNSYNMASIKGGSSGRRRPDIVSFTRGVHFSLCHGGMKLVLPRGLAPRTPAFAERCAWLLHFRSKMMVRHAGAAPTLSAWKADVLAVTPMTLKSWLRSELRRTLLVFSEALIYLSYTAVGPFTR